MKNLIYIAAVTLAFTVQGVSLAANTGLDDVDFKQIVCSSLQESNNKEETLTEVLSMTQSVINAQQKQTLLKLANEDMNSQAYCQNVDL